MKPERPRWMAVLRVILIVVALVFFASAIRGTYTEARELTPPTLPVLLATLAFSVIGLEAAGRGWASLLETANRRRLIHGFFLAQLGKYIPGSIWQVAGQIASARDAGAPIAFAATAMPVQVLIYISAGGSIGSLLAFSVPGPSIALRALFLALAGSVVLLKRTWMVAALRFVQRWIRRIPTDAVPSQRAIIVAYVWTVATLVASGVAFMVIAGALGIEERLTTVPAFGLAWTAGFLAIPVPAGLGVREALLIATLDASSGVIVAASIVHRLVTMLAEVLMIVFYGAIVRIPPKPHPDSSA